MSIVSATLSPTILLLVSTAATIYYVNTWSALYRKRRDYKREHGCLPIKVSYPFKDPILGLDLTLKIIGAAKEKQLLSFWNDMMQTSPTLEFSNLVNRAKGLGMLTIEPENIKAMLATRFDDWAVAPGRAVVTDFLGHGIFTTDGEFWAHSRHMIRPSFAKEQVADLEKLEEHMKALLQLIPSDGSTIDLQELFHRYTLDASTEALLGQSAYSLMPDRSEIEKLFARGFDIATADAITRIRAGIFYRLVPHTKAKAAIKTCRDAVEIWVNAAIEHSKKPDDEKDSKSDGERGKKYIFLYELAKQIDDRVRITDEAMNVLVAGRDTTASLISSLWFLLARHPNVWLKLQAEVDTLQGEAPTYEQLRDLKYLKYCANETLRLIPPVPMLGKTALRDTVLPVGGGPDGKSPVFVPKGANVSYNFHALHRRRSVYGDDAEDFNPDRWADPSFRPGWNFLPFGGGPRVCLGQQYALTETYYVTIRLMQRFRRIEVRDEEPWQEKLALTIASFNGTKVGLFEE